MSGRPIYLIGAVILISVLVTVYTMFDHWRNTSHLKADASVVDISRKRFNRLKYKTIVTFDDGFTYVSFRPESDPSGIGTPMGYRGEGGDEILQRAIEKHDELLNKKQ